MLTSLVINEREYLFKEEFDVNLTLDYENDSWVEWHILREFISNALDSVGGDKDRISIQSTVDAITISDDGEGYGIVLAKRIGASSKKTDSESIGQFGEGTKMALLTCLRLGLDVTLGSQNWLIQPFEKELECQRVLFYRVYETAVPAQGSFVQLQTTDKLRSIIEQLGHYFLPYSTVTPLWQSDTGSVYPRCKQEHLGRVYNKGVFIKEVEALFDYGVSMEKLNRDRDLMDTSELADQVGSLLRHTDQEEIIKAIIGVAAMEEEVWRPLIEFKPYLYTTQSEKWAAAFHSLFGQKAVLSTNELASLEAQVLGYQPLKLQSQIHRILKDAGVPEDVEKLREDYKIQWVSPGELTHQEKELLKQAKECAAAIHWECDGEIRVFSHYHDSDDITGLYLPETRTIGIKRSQLEKGLSATLGTLLHELAHLHSGADDYSRDFATAINEKLASTLLQLMRNNGVPAKANIEEMNLVLPSSLSITAQDLQCHLIVTGADLIVKTSQHRLRFPLLQEMEPVILKRRIRLSSEGFCVSLTDELAAAFGGQQEHNQSILCHQLE
ncbi:ATP-binding protein [Anoxynatronum sibiricum]|uniref:ATP-binding protein n=1 Tax=Anoxynatronum sibiricum TaxID=210623 RepID=A0ABU9VX45_9CLOT